MTNAIHVVREAGGLGDVIRIFAFLDGLRERWPDRGIIYHGPDKYEPCVMRGHCWGMDRPYCEYVKTDGQRLRPFRGAPIYQAWLRDHAPEATVYDLYCPAHAHERETVGHPTTERSELFRVDHLAPTRPVVWNITHADKQSAMHWIHSGGRMVIMGARAAGRIRNWPRTHWAHLGDMLRKRGLMPVWVDDKADYTRDLPGPHIIDQPIGYVAAMIARARFTVAVDSGIFHLSAAVGQRTIGLFGATNGELIAKPYSTAIPLQANRVGDCKGQCYGYPERGFGIYPTCADGCYNMSKLSPESVFEQCMKLAETR